MQSSTGTSHQPHSQNTLTINSIVSLENQAIGCKLGLLQDADVAGNFTDSISKSGVVLCIFGSRTIVPIPWACKKQTAVSHSSTEAEIISLDAGLRMEGTPATNLSDTIMDFLHLQAGGDSKPGLPTPIQKHQEPHLETLTMYLRTRDYSQHANGIIHLRRQRSCNKTIETKSSSPTLRHVPRTQRVDLDGLYNRINLHPMIQIKNVNTTQQMADILTKRSLTGDRWTQLTQLVNIMTHTTFTLSILSVSSTVVNPLFSSKSKRAGEYFATSAGAKQKPVHCSWLRMPTWTVTQYLHQDITLVAWRLVSARFWKSKLWATGRLGHQAAGDGLLQEILQVSRKFIIIQILMEKK